ncbi:FAD-binding oxidoreductase [Agaribacter flavus]|uniref:Pyridoxamine 5'-phosphate oxidase family protein n=1 Tax=Agaribacter flavus TaxID=1902781 RepID=A0ABV7FRA3_9ALTE
MFGKAGFIQSPNDKTLTISSIPNLKETLNLDFTQDKKIGLVGVELHTRRRNRMNGRIKHIGSEEFSISVEQSFGNCPQYIQKRHLNGAINTKRNIPSSLGLDSSPSKQTRRLVSQADTFFIASRTKIFSEDERCGIDASHRGGKPGFVKIDGDTLYFPDFSGNRFFNTLGNIKSDGRVGLFFPNFSNGEAVFISGDASIIWDEAISAKVEGAERVISIKIRNSIFIPDYLEMTGELEEMSPSLTNTGTWPNDTGTKQSSGLFTIINKRKESRDITSFYLAPKSINSTLKQYVPGQFLPIGVKQEGTSELINRSYTLSRAPADDSYRISVKREKNGTVSRILHDELHVGDTIQAGQPAGQFTLAENEHSIVFLSGGVGITPMLAMLESLVKKYERDKQVKKVWFIHGTQSPETLAFLNELNTYTTRYSWLNTHIIFSRSLPNNRNMDVKINSGRVNIELLKQILPFDHYDFYLCGSEPFMRQLYSGLTGMGIKPSNIFYEFFGQGSIEESNNEGLETAEETEIHFTKSNIKARWTQEEGSLLEFAEKQGLKPMYSCRVGNCGACSCGVNNGDVTYSNVPSFIADEGKVLLCSATPKRGTTTLSIDL